MAVTDIELDVELLKKEVSDMKQIHGRLDTAITKITDVSNCINRMLAVHEEKISQQEEVQIRQASEFSNDVKELHSRITTSTKEMTELMTKQHSKEARDFLKPLVPTFAILLLVNASSVVAAFNPVREV